MSLLRGLLLRQIRASSCILKNTTPMKVQRRQAHEGWPKPFDNMPFSITNRYATTLFFAVFFGVGFWAPYLIVFYQMIKRTL